MLNVAAIMGRLTAEPELKYTASGLAFCRFTVAVDRNYAKAGTERQADFISCVAWRKTAEFVCKYFIKGQLMAVDGTIQTGSYTDKDGNKRYTTDLLVNNVNFAGHNKGDTGGAPTDAVTADTRTDKVTSQDEPVDIDYDDLPF